MIRRRTARLPQMMSATLPWGPLATCRRPIEEANPWMRFPSQVMNEARLMYRRLPGPERMKLRCHL
jgi:hypothetical protein